MNRCVCRRCVWSDLPPELLDTIVNHLRPNDDDLQVLRTVCKHWRNSIPPPLHRLSPVLPQDIPSSDNTLASQILVPTAVYLLRPHRNNSAFSSASPWLVSVEQISNNFRKLRLFHPLTGLPIKTLPDNFPKGLYNFHALEVSKGCKIRYHDGTTPQMQLKTDYFVVKNKVVFWPAPRHSQVCCRMMQLSNGKLTWKFTLNNLGMKDSRRRLKKVLIIDDIVYWEGMMLAVDSKGNSYNIDYFSLDTYSHMNSAGPDGHMQRSRFLVFNDDLYLVIRHSNKSRTTNGRFMVYKRIKKPMNHWLYSWEYVESLGDKVLFVSPDTCFFVQATDLPGIPGNCTVFAVYTKSNKLDKGNCGIGMCTYGEDSEFKLISSCPGFSGVFWPPPKWIS